MLILISSGAIACGTTEQTGGSNNPGSALNFEAGLDDNRADFSILLATGFLRQVCVSMEMVAWRRLMCF